ncbi:hypothetical protein KU06112801_350001 [Flavobacterium psychrophilum]|uniref:hypothetical protein n=1 Tax=Flavobacterium psychrophilum TaxID=96345 RepID=UPI000B7C14BD|nr:hypothetical protein [Flavobacterium psychrophilum]SNB13894.1 hypothetical protein KU06112801_350001 [Flavobacterium psychrophilum]
MSESTKPTENEAENGNKSKPLLCEVAVLVRYYRFFLEFQKKFQKENEKFIPIMKIDDARGRVFSRVEYTIHWHDMDDFWNVEKEVISRVRNNLA